MFDFPVSPISVANSFTDTGTLSVAGATTLSTLTVNGAANFTAAVSVTAATVLSSLNVTGALSQSAGAVTVATNNTINISTTSGNCTIDCPSGNNLNLGASTAGTVNLGNISSNTFINGPNVFFVPTAAASAGATMKNSGTFTVRGYYWNGSSSASVDTGLQAIVTSTTPTVKMSFQLNGGAERAYINDAGLFNCTTLNANSLDVNSAGPLTVGTGTATTMSVGRGAMSSLYLNAANVYLVGNGTTGLSVDSNGTTYGQGGFRHAWSVSQTSNYTVSTGDYFVNINTTNSAITVALPAVPNKGTVYVIKDVTGHAASQNITVSVSTLAGVVIDGVSTKTINTNYGVLRLSCDGLSSYFTW